MDARVLHGLNLAFDAALAEAARHQDRIHAVEQVRPLGGNAFRIHVADIDARARLHTGVQQRLGQRFVGFREVEIVQGA